MPDITGDGFARLDMSKPEDVQLLINTGQAWRSGPQTLQKVLRMVTSGDVTRVPAKETPEVAAFLNKVAPVEPVIVDEQEPPVA